MSPDEPEKVRGAGSDDDASATAWLRRGFGWIWRRGRVAADPTAGQEHADTEAGILLRILIAAVWLPIQITLALFFATGGIFFVLIFGMLAGPFVALYFLIRHLLRSDPNGNAPEATANGDPSGSAAADTAPSSE